MQKTVIKILFGSAFVLSTQIAQAHSLPVDNGTINVNGDTAYLVLSLPVHALQNVDDNADGKLSYDEYNSHQQSIQTQIKSGFIFINQQDNGNSKQQLSIISLTPTVAQDSHSHSHEPMSQAALEQLQATHITTLASVRFANNIEQLQVNSDFFKTSAADYQFTLFAKQAQSADQASQHPKREKAILSASQTNARFFDGDSTE